MPQAFEVIPCSRILTRASLYGVLVLLVLLAGVMGECAVTEKPTPPPEQPAPSPELVPVAPGPPPPRQEQILSPIPRQFDWMRRDVRPNPALESVLGVREVRRRLLMSISLAEEYTDNFFLDERDRDEEYRTSVNLGTVYRLESGRSFVSLASSLTGTYDALAEEGNFAFANLAINTGYRLPRLSLALSESFIRSDEAEEASRPGVRRERRIFTTNSISPQVRYDLTRTTAINGRYTNTLVWNENGGGGDDVTTTGDQRSIQGDSVSHAFSTGLQHWFSRDLSGSGGYTFTTVNRSEEGDTQSHSASADFAYVISPRTSATFGAFGTLFDRRDGDTGGDVTEGDSKIFGLSVGARRQLTTYLAAFASVGPLVVSREDAPTRVFANWQVSLDGTVPLTRRLTLGASTQQSINDTAGETDDVGLVLSQSATATLNYAVSRDLLASLFANYTRTQLLEDIATDVSTEDGEFTYWSVGTRVSYALTPVWSLSLSYRYQQRDSDVAAETIDDTAIGGNYHENRVIFSLSAAFPVF